MWVTTPEAAQRLKNPNTGGPPGSPRGARGSVFGSRLTTRASPRITRTASDTEAYDTAHTSHRSWVSTTSAPSRASASVSSVYSDDPRCAAPPTASEISRLPRASAANSARVTTGIPETSSAGQSHSWVRPTSRSPRPSSTTMSVAAGNNETILMARE